jgi:hypothetical protein
MLWRSADTARTDLDLDAVVEFDRAAVLSTESAPYAEIEDRKE